MKLTHPDTPDVVINADEDRAAMLKSAGWVEVPAKPKK